MRRWLFFVYGVSAHAGFFLLFAYMAGFVGNFLVPKSIDTPAAGSITMSIIVDLLLLLAFALQHSVMARPGFKQVWTRIVPPVIERATYVWLSTAVTVLLMWQWRGIDIVVWDAHNPLLRGALWALFVVGWLLVPLASLLINHFDLFGTRQVWLHLTGREYGALPFRTPLFYKHVRHPLYVGWAIAFWAIPTMTVGHLLFAVTLTTYMVIATFFEERDLVDYFGEQYDSYRRAVPKFIPRWRIGSPRAEDLADDVPGITHVQNNLRATQTPK
jgi:protein-S-isoprenylcysteine O-methyltransferase Ste14